MTTFSEELRKAREARNISLAEISRVTRISLKYLEAIDQGSFDVLPQTYIRAFLREYAQAVGLSPVEVLQKYDILVTGKYSAGQTPAPASAGWSGGHVPTLQEPPRDAEGERPSEETLVKQRSMRTIVIIVSIIVMCSLILAFIVNYIWTGRSGPGVRETPFEEVVREKERQNAPPAKPDTLHAPKDSAAAAAAKTAAASDSLTLTVQPSGRVWISIARDSLRSESQMLPADKTLSLRAKQRFTVTVGNAGAATFSVNGKDIGPVGKKGDVIRNIVITREGIAYPGVRQVPAAKQPGTQQKTAPAQKPDVQQKTPPARKPGVGPPAAMPQRSGPAKSSTLKPSHAAQKNAGTPLKALDAALKRAGTSKTSAEVKSPAPAKEVSVWKPAVEKEKRVVKEPEGKF